MNPPVPQKPAPGGPQLERQHLNQHHDDQHRHRHSIYAAEATGLLLIAFLLLILTIIRYWQYIPWSAR